MKRMFWLSFVFCLFSLIFLISLISLKFISASSTVRFLYDGDGARVAKIEEGKTTLYVGDLEKDLTSGQVTKYYGLGGKRIAVKTSLPAGQAGLPTGGEGSNLSFLVLDHLGSLRTLLAPRSLGEVGSSLSNLLAPSESASGGEVGGDLDASSIAKVSYYPYGSVRTKSDNLPSRQYTGQINDEQTGLYFYNARYYNPQTANFLQADKGGGANKYAYVSGNPINFNDPSGNDDEPIDFVSPGNSYPGTGISSSQEINSTILGPITCLNTPEGCTQEQINQWNTESLSMTGQVSYAAMNVIFIAAAAPSIAVLVEGFIANLPVIGNKAAPEMEQIITDNVLPSTFKALKAAKRDEAILAIRAKYGLPPRSMRRYDSYGYIRRLEEIAVTHGISIVPDYELASFYKEGFAGGVSMYTGRGKIISARRTPDIFGYIQVLEHELIHALQGPRMSFWKAEYEAYISGFPRGVLMDPRLRQALATAIRLSVRVDQKMFK